MSSARSIRVSQRQPKACKECTKRKVRCDKRYPCSGCLRRSTTCVREIVRISKASTVHREELEFLQGLAENLKISQNIAATLSDLHCRIRDLEHGPLATTEPHASPFDASKKDRVASGSSNESSSPGPCSASLSSSNIPGATKAPGTSPQGSGFMATTPSDHHDDRQGQESNIQKIEFLAWGRHTGKCFPHRSCQCRSVRPYAEIVSINADPNWIGIQRLHYRLPSAVQLPVAQARTLIQFHFDEILWHHNVFHAPTFLAQCEEFWSAGTVHHPLWTALYHSVLAVSLWTVLNSRRHLAGLVVSEATVSHFFRAMVSTLYDESFLERPSLYSIQAITLSTRIVHNLGMSELNATLLGAAIRIAHCLGLHKIANDDDTRAIVTLEDWYTTVETEVGRRCWLQLIIQDYFQIPFTQTYMIQPSHFSTGLPKNCDDDDMIDRDEQVPTISSYTRMLSRIALLMPPLLDGLGHAQRRRSLNDAYKQILSSEQELRALLKSIPAFFLNSGAFKTGIQPEWITVARRTLSISTADKVIMIHRPIIYHAFQNHAFPRTRQICLSAALTILREHEVVFNTNTTSLWTHSAFCITAVMVIGLELLFRDIHIDDESQKLRDVLNDTAMRLRKRRCDVIAERGASLIDTFIKMEEQLVIQVIRQSRNSVSTSTFQRGLASEIVGKNEVIANFLTLSFQSPYLHLVSSELSAGSSAQGQPEFMGQDLTETELFETDLPLGHLSEFWNFNIS